MSDDKPPLTDLEMRVERAKKAWEDSRARQAALDASAPKPASIDTETGAVPLLPQKPKENLPPWPEGFAGTPNAWLRGALFSAIQGKDRRFFQEVVLEAVKPVKIVYTGWQLDQSDLDVWETLVILLHFQPLGQGVTFSAHSILKMLGRDVGGQNHKWLEESFNRLSGCIARISTPRHDFLGSLMCGSRDKATGQYSVYLHPDILRFYKDGWTQIDWQQRQALRGKPLALWLHGWYCSHASAYDLKVETIAKLSGSRNPCMRSFKRQIATALDDLVAVGAVGAWSITDGLVSVDREPSQSQKKHLAKKSRAKAESKRGRGPRAVGDIIKKR